MFQSIRQKSVDWCLLAIIVLFGIAIFMNRSFLVSIRCYGYLEICITVLAISAYLLGRSTKIYYVIRSLSIASLLMVISVFTYWNIKAQKIPGKIDIVELNGYARGRFEEVLFKYDGEPFSRHCSLKDYSSISSIAQDGRRLPIGFRAVLVTIPIYQQRGRVRYFRQTIHHGHNIPTQIITQIVIRPEKSQNRSSGMPLRDHNCFFLTREEKAGC